MTRTLLAQDTIYRLRTRFTCYGLHLTPDMWAGIEDLTLCLQRMADGEADQTFFLSSLDPGVGKTQTVLAFLLSLLSSPRHEGVGVVVFTFTKEEIKTFVKEALAVGLPKHTFAARVQKDDREVNELGCGDPERARILFTTQQRLLTICTDRKFSEVAEFRYRDCARRVRVWDESLLPAHPVLLDGRQIAGLYPHLPKDRTGLVDDLDRFRECLKTAEDRSLIDIPDLASSHRLSAAELQRVLRDKQSETQKAAADLWGLFGKKVIVRKDGVRKDGIPEPKLVHYRESLPDDLAPLVILDASGRVATTYSWWETHRGSLFRLKAGHKSYDNLTIHVWRIGGGAHAFDRDDDDGGLALRRSGIVQTIKSKLAEPWLVICHKKHEERLRREIGAELIGTGVSVEFTHWGLHRATNQYRDIPNIILAGTQFLPASALEAQGRAASGLPPAEDGPLTDQQERELLIGDQSDIILQAVCRGSARGTVDGGTCSRSDVYLIAHPRHGIIEQLQDVFPECRIEEWTPVRRPATGKVAEALDYIDRWFADHPDGELRFKEMYQSLGIDRSNFHKLRKHEDFLFGIAERGIEPDRPGGYARAFRCVLEVGDFSGDFKDYFGETDDDDEDGELTSATEGTAGPGHDQS